MHKLLVVITHDAPSQCFTVKVGMDCSAFNLVYFNTISTQSYVIYIKYYYLLRSEDTIN